MPTPMIIDTDTAQDDCVAILVGLLDPEAELRAITMVAGNVGFDRQVRNALMTLNAAGRLGEVPVFEGCRRPILRPWESASSAHGDGSGGLEMDVSDVGPEGEHAVDALLRLTRESPGELHILCIGPLTNIALATIKDPSFVDHVGSLTIMGGSNNGRGNITAAAEFNFYVDPEAARVVFEAGFADVTVVTWDPVTLRDATFPRPDFDRLCSIGTPASDFFARVCAHTVDFNERVGVPGTTHPDSMAAAILLHPELVLEAASYRVDVETASELTRGYSAMAWEERHGADRNARIVERADRDGFLALLERVLSTETTPNRPFQ